MMVFLQETPQNSLENLITFTHAGRQIFADIHNRSYLTVDYLRVARRRVLYHTHFKIRESFGNS